MKIAASPGWPRPKGYSNGISATGRLIVTAGVVGWDEPGAFRVEHAPRPIRAGAEEHRRDPWPGRREARSISCG